MTDPAPRPLLRRAAGTPVAGVCLGIARHLQVSAPVVRAVMIGLAIAGGLGVLLYCWLWIFVPAEDEPAGTAGERGLSGPAVDAAAARGGAAADAADRGESGDDRGGSASRGPENPADRVRAALDSLTSSPEVLAGGLLLGAAGLLALTLVGVPLNWRLVGPPAVIVVGVLLAWSQMDRTGRGGGRREALWQVAAGAGLVVVALLVLAGGFVPAGDLLVGLMVALMLLAGVVLVVAPWLLRMYRTMAAERARAAAEAERADIAAHLHDSVLQTLAMIRKQRGDPAAVEHLARRQERQLRGWLYRRDAADPGTLKDQLIAVGAELEELHGAAVDVVAVGESRAGDHRVLVAAAREAMVNALTHAGPASVYVESDAAVDAVFIRDRGSGFDVDAVGEDRMGVRESIIGRMRRGGGEARIRSGERGTEVELTMPVEHGAEERDDGTAETDDGGGEDHLGEPRERTRGGEPS
ncbi:ATP-binding protein [Nesterenkonia sp. F]|uniref:ATP-binding protein n=1 Tax=Nesterenkonia sp. F TaxID=795955 RepID=UPI000255D1CC|nr:ATP-binding protein [Nesterenkonia sp. F]